MADALGLPPVVVESLQTHTPLDPRTEALTCARSMTRSYDKGSRTSCRLCRRTWHSTLCPVRVTQ